MVLDKEPANQHFIPKFILKNFIDTDGRIYCFNIISSKITKPPPKHAGSEVSFYEFPKGEQFVSFENKLQKIENRAAPIFRKIIKSATLSTLTSNERKRVADFVYVQSFRTKAFLGGLPDLDDENVGKLFETLWSSSIVTSQEIQNRKWLLMRIEHENVFYLGDQPVVLQDEENPSKAQSIGFDVLGAAAYLPITPKLALYMPCLSITEQIISAYQTSNQLHPKIRAAEMSGVPLPDINPDTIALIKRVLQNSSRFYEAVMNGVPYICTPEDVENLNCLQCAWASEEIFSNLRDFQFAENVFKNSPQYRDAMNTKTLYIGNFLRPKDFDGDSNSNDC